MEHKRCVMYVCSLSQLWPQESKHMQQSGCVRSKWEHCLALISSHTWFGSICLDTLQMLLIAYGFQLLVKEPHDNNNNDFIAYNDKVLEQLRHMGRIRYCLNDDRRILRRHSDLWSLWTEGGLPAHWLRPGSLSLLPNTPCSLCSLIGTTSLIGFGNHGDSYSVFELIS